jgi:DNA polymerase I-like protein with 3'-5' exonuclease and polymerase domains
VESELDYHKWNAHKFFGVPYAEITPALRQLAKRVGHGANYSMGAQVLLETMGPRAVGEARLLLKLPAKWTLPQVTQHLLNTYAQAYPEVKLDWYNDIKRTIKMTKKLVSPLGHTRHFFADPSTNKPAMNAAVAHGPQNLSGAVLNIVFYKIWHETVYGDLRGKVRIKAQIHDSILYCYNTEDSPARIKAMMTHTVRVKDIHGIERDMLIPPDMNSGAISWAGLK